MVASAEAVSIGVLNCANGRWAAGLLCLVSGVAWGCELIRSCER